MQPQPHLNRPKYLMVSLVWYSDVPTTPRRGFKAYVHTTLFRGRSIRHSLHMDSTDCAPVAPQTARLGAVRLR